MTTGNLPNDVASLRVAFEEILETARRAPSGVNTQPWQLVVVGAKSAASLASVIEQELGSLVSQATSLFPSSPEGLLRDQFRAVQAPLFALCMIDRRLGPGSELDYGMFLQNIRLLAGAKGLEANVLPAWRVASALVDHLLPVPDHRVLCALTIAEAQDGGSEGTAQRVEARWLD